MKARGKQCAEARVITRAFAFILQALPRCDIMHAQKHTEVSPMPLIQLKTSPYRSAGKSCFLTRICSSNPGN